MNEFLEAAVQLPTLIFTIGLGVVLVYWVFVILGGVSDELLGGDGIDLDVGGGGGGGPISRLLDALGITTVPATVVVSFLVLFSWFFCLVLAGIVDDLDFEAPASTFADIGAALAAVVLALPATALSARPFRRFYVHTPAQLRRSFVGKVCRIRTGHVSDAFGQAELIDDDGASLVVQVRSPEVNDLASGDLALIYSYDEDAEVFLVARADESLSPG